MYVAFAGGAFGPAGERTPLEAGTPFVIVFGPEGPNAAGL